MTQRITLIHATMLSVAPINSAFERHWPEAQRMHLLDDSLSRDRAADGELTAAMTNRFEQLARYAASTGCHGILFTCSAFGPAIEAARRVSGVPTLKPNEAMFDQALALGAGGKHLRLGLVATFQGSIASMSDELLALATQRGIFVDLQCLFVPEAMDDLAQGRAEDHHRKIAQASRALASCDAVMLAQFSMAAAQPAVQRELSCPVLTSPDCAVLALRQAMANA